MDSGLREDAVLITGASGGIGSAIARAFAEESARLVLHGFRNRAALQVLESELPGEVLLALADLRREQEVDAMFDQATARFGRIDSLIVNAGIWPSTPTPLADLSLERWHETIETDLTSAFLCCRAFLRHLRRVPRDHASIVLVASTAALFGEADHTDYAAAKAAMTFGLTASLKNEIVRIAPRGRVNCVCPGWTRTPMTEAELADQRLVAQVVATMPLKKVATAEDVARAVVFLSSERLAGHLTGVVLPIAGGMEGRVVG